MADAAVTTATYAVTGMTCEHCARAVRDEIGRLPGVVGVDVDLATGRVQVASDGTVADADADADAEVRAAVAEAGYEVAS
jgi:copper chaperone